MSQLHDAGLSPLHLRDVPDAYPRSLEAWVELRDGSKIFVRPIAPVDGRRMAHALAFGDPETIQRRFLTGAPPKVQGAIDYLVNVDYGCRLALIAMDEEGNSVGISRYEGNKESETAEVAIVVDAQWRHKGVGSVLLELLEPNARAAGIKEFVGLYQPDNTEVAALLKSLGYEPAPMDEGLVSVTKRLS